MQSVSNKPGHRPGRPARPARRPPRPRWFGPETGFGRGLGTGLGFAIGAGIVLLALSLLTTVTVAGTALIGLGRNDARQSPANVLWGPANASNTLLAISISGAIEGAGSGTLFGTATYGYEIADQLDALDADDYDGVILLMDTPGGSIYGARAIAEAVIRYQERTGHSVVAYVQSMAASGGMYAMAPADLIISDYGTFVGSIGVIFGPFERYRQVTGLTGNLLTSGVETAGGITSEYLTRGTGKDFGNPYRDMTDLERHVYTTGLQVEYDQFVSFVAQHRGISSDTIRNELGAFMFDPRTAVDKGLVDEVMGRAAGFQRAAAQNEIDQNDFKVVAPAMPGTWAQLFGAEARVFGHNVPLSRESGVLPTSELCVGAPLALAYSGDLAVICGS